MFEVIVNTIKGTPVAHIRCTSDTCKLGKSKSNLVVLHGMKIAKEHAIIELAKDGVYVIDISNSRTGIIVNDVKIEKSGPLSFADEIQIGGYIIKIKPPLSMINKSTESNGLINEQSTSSNSDLSNPELVPTTSDHLNTDSLHELNDKKTISSELLDSKK